MIDVEMSHKKAATPVAGTSTDPRRARTRQAIIRAGQDVFSRHDADGVSMDELCKLAAVSKQSFYNHFTDKDALARELLHIARAELDELVSRAIIGQTDPAKRIAYGLCVAARHALAKPEQASLLARLPLNDMSPDSEDNMHLVAELRAGLDQGRLTIPTIDSALAFLLGVSRALINHVLIDGQVRYATATSQHMVTMALRGFGVEPGEAGLIAAQAANLIICI